MESPRHGRHSGRDIALTGNQAGDGNTTGEVQIYGSADTEGVDVSILSHFGLWQFTTDPLLDTASIQPWPYFFIYRSNDETMINTEPSKTI